MNKIISKIAQSIRIDEEQNYAVVIANGKERYGLFNISTPKEAEDSLKKVAMNEDNIPDEILEVAMGVMNTVYMSKSGSEWPLFINVVPRDTNLLDNNSIDWNSYELIQKNANRKGVVYNKVFLPLDTKTNIKSACELLEEHKKNFSGIDRVKFASAIAEAATEFKIQVTDIVTKYAFGTLNPDFYELMDERIEIAKDYPETQTLLKNIREDASSLSTDKVAEALEITDGMLPFSMKFVKQVKLGSNKPGFYAGINVPDAFNTVYGVQIRPKTIIEKVANLSDEKLGIYFSEVFIEKLRNDPQGVIDRAPATVMKTLRNMVV